MAEESDYYFGGYTGMRAVTGRPMLSLSCPVADAVASPLRGTGGGDTFALV